MKLGTRVRLPDGREGTVVFNGLSGAGVKWGIHNPDPADFDGTAGDWFGRDPGPDWPWRPDAMLRRPALSKSLGIECVGEAYEVLRDGLGEEVTG